MRDYTTTVECLTDGQEYGISTTTDIEELVETIRLETVERFAAEGEMFLTGEVIFAFVGAEPLLEGFIKDGELSADLPEAIELLEKATYDKEIYEAYQENVGDSLTDTADLHSLIDRADEAYSGAFRTDEEFAEETAISIGAIDPRVGARWPHNCIDWEQAASELMQDYFEVNGHYFRSI